MSSQLRTFFAVLAAVAICFLLASLNWLLVLYVFVALSLGCAFWSTRRENNNPQRRALEHELDVLPTRRRPRRLSDSRRRALRNGNVYQFPLADAPKPEAADS